MKKGDRMKTKEIDSFLIVDGHVVTVSFTHEPNPEAKDRMREMLLASYSNSRRFADSDEPVYDDGGEAHAP